MPCYQVITAKVEFKVGNIDILKKALEANAEVRKGSVQHFVGRHSEHDKISFRDKIGTLINVDLTTGKMIAAGYDEKQLIKFSNSIKRGYSEVVLDEVAKKQKWLKKKMGENHFQLQRF